VGGEFDAVVFRRIVRSREVNGTGSLERANRVSDGRRGRGVGDDDGRNNGAGEDAGRFGDKALAKKARVTTDENAMGLRLGLDVCGNACDGEANVGQRKFVGNDGPPSGGAEFNDGTHRCSPQAVGASAKSMK